MRLIDADFLKSEKVYSHERHEYVVPVYTIDMARTIDRPHGEWEWQTEDKYRCTNCGEVVRVKEVMNVPQYNFCPNCGADMRKLQANDRQVTGKLNSEIENSKSEIVPDYRDGWRLKEGDTE